jgi:hypothetical protein
MREVWFWQRIISPHMAVLAVALARTGCRVTYVAEEVMSSDRAALGWQAPKLPGVELRRAATAKQAAALAADAPAQSVHLCQGIRANGVVAVAQHALARRGLGFWVMMETVEDAGLAGRAKRLLYRAQFLRWRRHMHGVLAIGRQTAQWVRARGVPDGRVVPFAYFLQDDEGLTAPQAVQLEDAFRILFVGRCIELKRLDLLMDALASVADRVPEFRLQVIGSGPLEGALRSKAECLFGQRLEWLGQLPMHEARQRMALADCLVLPSRYDGWGAVVSEALMAGTPAICSDACGAADAVLASGVGGVFAAGDRRELELLLSKQIVKGRPGSVERSCLAQWAQSLGAGAGAAYLLSILAFSHDDEIRPLPPWRRSPKMVKEGAE